ncbi:MAG TPA: metallopeptidase family protein [Candidatus Limnocylindrales bacterium]|nr:metallopeptidase family protein [Candidatus Limnocylindrales bacterium]
MALKRRGRQAQRQPGRRVDLPPLPAARHQPFEVLVERALDGLPDEVLSLLENVAVVIDDEPTPDQLRESGLGPRDSLYGLYEGVSPVTYGADLVPFPNKITLFRLPLEEDFPDPEELAREVQKTVVHEVGHHAGIDEQRLHQLGF